MTSLSEEIICTCGASGALDGHSWSCPLRSGISPAESARRQEARKRQQTQAYFAELAGNEEAYSRVAEFLEPEERVRIAELRERRLAGDTSAYYGHDLMGAISRGHDAQSRIKLREAMELQAQRFARNDNKTKLGVGMAMHLFVDAAAELGLTADEIRHILQRELGCNDSTRIEKRVEKHHPEHPTAPPRV